MRGRLTVFIMAIAGIIFGLMFARQLLISRDLPREKYADKKLRILTYGSFIGTAGPGTHIFNEFEIAHKVKIEVVTVPDAGLLLERLKMSKDYDVVIGLDQLLLPKARETSEWLPVPMDQKGWVPIVKAEGDQFIPFDWSPMTFVYRRNDGLPPAHFDELLDPRFKNQFALEDPHASTPGRQFYDWVRILKGDQTLPFLANFKASVHTVSPSWTLAYAIFKKKQAGLVFTYLTSLAYHWGEEKDENYQAVTLPEGHPMQIEYAAVPKTCGACELGVSLVQELLKLEAQKQIMAKNYMFPVVFEATAGTVFATLPELKILTPGEPLPADFAVWDQVFKQ